MKINRRKMIGITASIGGSLLLPSLSHGKIKESIILKTGLCKQELDDIILGCTGTNFSKVRANLFIISNIIFDTIQYRMTKKDIGINEFNTLGSIYFIDGDLNDRYNNIETFILKSCEFLNTNKLKLVKKGHITDSTILFDFDIHQEYGGVYFGVIKISIPKRSHGHKIKKDYL